MLSKAAADSIEQHADAAVASYLVLLAFIGQRAYTELAAAASAPTGDSLSHPGTISTCLP